MTATIRHRIFAIFFRTAGALFAMIAAAAAPAARAGVGKWTTNGPYGGVILALAVDPSNSSTIYAATPKRVYKSIDAGIRWEPFGHFGPVDILLPTSDPSTVYLAGNSQYVLRRTTDGGKSWVERSAPRSGSDSLSDLVADPNDPATLYAIVSQGGFRPRLFRSRDGADSWEALVLPGDVRVASVAVDPENPRVLYLAIYERTEGVFRSSDGGATWSRTRLEQAVYKLVPGKNSRLYAFAVTGVQVTTDGGASWTRIFPGVNSASDLAIDPTDFRRLYLLASNGTSLYTSEDGGRTVRELRNLGGGLRAVVVPERFVVLVGSHVGVHRNSDPLEPWVKSNSGISESTVGSIAVDPDDPGIVLAGTEAGIYESGDGGATWNDPRSGSPFSAIRIAIDPAQPSTRYAASPTGLHKSADGGATWRLRNPTGLLGTIAELVIDPNNPRRILASYGNSLYRSLDGADTWRKVLEPEEDYVSYYYSPELTAVGIAPSDTATMYAGSWSEVGSFLYRSLDGGDSWSKLSASPYVWTLAIDSCDPQILQAATGSGMKRSLDGGHTWDGSFVADGVNIFSELVRDPRHPSSYFVGTSNGVYWTNDRGASWTRFEPGLNEPVFSLALDPSGRFLHAGTGAGVYSFERNFEPCRDGAGRLCLIDRKFELSVTARRGTAVVSGHAIVEGDQFGYFSFPELTGDASVPEVFVKMVDASAAPPPYGGHTWVFHSSLTDLDYTLTVRETESGRVRTYRAAKPSSLDLSCGVADTTGFERSCEAGAASSTPGAATPLSAGSGGELSLLGGRFRATVRARDPRSGRTAEGAAIARADGFGYFSLPGFTDDSSFPEVFVKMVDGRSQPGSSFWVFHTGLTDLEYTLEITDGVTGRVRSYVRPVSDGTALCGRADTNAFPN